MAAVIMILQAQPFACCKHGRLFTRLVLQGSYQTCMISFMAVEPLAAAHACRNCMGTRQQLW